jgi:hypothetical protein
MGVPFGPGTVTFTWGAAAPENFECEVTGGSIAHSYEDVDQATRLCDTVKRPPRKVRAGDSLKLSLAPDFDAASLYSRLQEHDLEPAAIEFVPNTVDGPTWSGTVVCTLPDEVSAGGWGEDLEAEVELMSTGTFVYTPAGA